MTTTATRLPVLRRQLSDLRRARRTVRWGTAYSATAIAALWLLGGLWALDVAFELSVAQRAVMIVILAATAVWSFARFTRPLLGVRESELDLALAVERRHGIDTDLVAALQFESPAAGQWGSRELESAVIDRVASLGAGLDVFSGFSRDQLIRRSAVLATTAVAVLLAAALFPEHARVFGNRLLLGHRHYPTKTILERIVVGNERALTREIEATWPRTIAVAQGQFIKFQVVCSGRLPEKATARIQSLIGGVARQIDLIPLGPSEREERLRRLADRLNSSVTSGAAPSDSEERYEFLTILEAELPEVARLWRDAEDSRASWESVQSALTDALAAWSPSSVAHHVYIGELGRLVDSARYKIHAGDAWTDPAEIHMTPRPTIELQFAAESPSYAQGGDAVRDVGPRQLAVLEGSKVRLAVECTNEKPLREAWLTIKTDDGPKRIELVSDGKDGLRWQLPPEATPFSPVTSDLRFTVQVRDQDGLSLETPIAGLVRIKPDKPPHGSIDVVHRVVLPQAHPAIQFRAQDDYGIAKLLLHLDHERPHNERALAPTESAADRPSEESSATTEAARRTVSLLDGAGVVRPDRLPLSGHREVPLGPLNLNKGDRLKLTLEVVDDRGAKQGESYLSEPVYLEISDEAGVLSAILEADERSEQRLSDIIKRQLGIREAP